MADQLHLWLEDPPDGLRWSVSRHKRISDCLRKYYLHHFGSRGGFKPDAPKHARELAVLRGLSNRYMWVGKVVHELIEIAFNHWRRRESVPVDGLVERGTRMMRAQYAESLQGVYWERPLQAVGLAEHEYREPISRDEWRERRDHMEKCVRNFFKLELIEKIQNTPQWRWLAVESLGSFELDGATVVVRPDFAMREEDDSVVLVDWKTGLPRPDDERLQLAVYGMFAQRSWGLSVDHVQGVIAYLASGEMSHTRLTREELVETESVVRDSLEQMRGLGGEGTPVMRDFPMTDDLERCTLCSFRRVCGREEASAP